MRNSTVLLTYSQLRPPVRLSFYIVIASWDQWNKAHLTYFIRFWQFFIRFAPQLHVSNPSCHFLTRFLNTTLSGWITTFVNIRSTLLISYGKLRFILYIARGTSRSLSVPIWSHLSGRKHLYLHMRKRFSFFSFFFLNYFKYYSLIYLCIY